MVTIFYHDRRLAIHFSELPRDEPDHPMLQIMRIIDEDRLTQVDILECCLEIILSYSFSVFIQVLELCEELIRSSISREEPSECRHRGIHTTCRIDTRTDLEPDDISILRTDPISPREEFPESVRSRMMHLLESQ
jgi:hypothetical protein